MFGWMRMQDGPRAERLGSALRRCVGLVGLAGLLTGGLAATLTGTTSPTAAAPDAAVTGPLAADQAVRGWTILSDREPDALAVIAAASAYRINHLQLSHEIVHDLRELREPKRLALVRRLIDAAHRAGIQEVVLWDHAFYDLDYYPARFRTGPKGTLDLDNPAFWEWLRPTTARCWTSSRTPTAWC